MTVGAEFSPKHVVVALTHSAQQARQADDEEIQPPETLAVGGVPKLVHTKRVGQDEASVFATHLAPQPQVDEGTQRNAAAKSMSLARNEGDASEGIDAIHLSGQSPNHRIQPAGERLRQLPSEPRKQLPHAPPRRPPFIGQKKASGDLSGEAETVRERFSH